MGNETNPEVRYGQSEPWDPGLEGELFLDGWKRLTGCPPDVSLEAWRTNPKYKEARQRIEDTQGVRQLNERPIEQEGQCGKQ